MGGTLAGRMLSATVEKDEIGGTGPLRSSRSREHGASPYCRSRSKTTFSAEISPSEASIEIIRRTQRLDTGPGRGVVPRITRSSCSNSWLSATLPARHVHCRCAPVPGHVRTARKGIDLVVWQGGMASVDMAIRPAAQLIVLLLDVLPPTEAATQCATPSDSLAAILALSEEELIALFS